MLCSINKIGKIFQVVNPGNVISYTCEVDLTTNGLRSAILFYFPQIDSYRIVSEERTKENLKSTFTYTDHKIPVGIIEGIYLLMYNNLSINKMKYTPWLELKIINDDNGS